MLREAIAGAPDTCVTLEVTGDSTKWVQVVDHTVNAAYPHQADALQVLDALPQLGGLQLSAWEGGIFATFEFEDSDVQSLAVWIDSYFVTILGCPEGEYHLDTKAEKL